MVGAAYNSSIWPTIWRFTPDSATLLPNGKVLFTLFYWDDSTGSTALYDPSTATFSPSPDATERYSRTATLLGDGAVLIAGLNYSHDFPNQTSRGDLYDPAAGTLSATGNMMVGRISHTATLLPDGTVLLAGGLGPDAQRTDAAEIYHPAVLTPSPVLYSLPGTTQAAVWRASTGELASSSKPAAAGEILSMYTTNLIEGGVIAPQVVIGGRLAEVLYFGDAPGYAGYYQVNFRMPEGIASGPDVSLRLSYFGRPSNEVTIGVQ